jgi:hypothetical protein
MSDKPTTKPPTPVEKSKFTDPYGHLYPEQLVRVQTWMDKNDHSYIRAVRPQSGTITVINNTLWSKLITKLKEHGINDYTQLAELEAAIIGLEIVLPGKSKLSGGTTRRTAKKP